MRGTEAAIHGSGSLGDDRPGVPQFAEKLRFPSAIAPQYSYTLFISMSGRQSMFWLMKCTDPSASVNSAPFGWKENAPRAQMLLLFRPGLFGSPVSVLLMWPSPNPSVLVLPNSGLRRELSRWTPQRLP